MEWATAELRDNSHPFPGRFFTELSDGIAPSGFEQGFYIKLFWQSKRITGTGVDDSRLVK
jgi:hypothetical protein